MAEVNYIVRLKDLVSPTLQKLINKSNELSSSVEQVSKKGSMIGDFVKGSLITQGIGMVTGGLTGMIEKTIDFSIDDVCKELNIDHETYVILVNGNNSTSLDMQLNNDSEMTFLDIMEDKNTNMDNNFTGN